MGEGYFRIFYWPIGILILASIIWSIRKKLKKNKGEEKVRVNHRNTPNSPNGYF